MSSLEWNNLIIWGVKLQITGKAPEGSEAELAKESIQEESTHLGECQLENY